MDYTKSTFVDQPSARNTNALQAAPQQIEQGVRRQRIAGRAANDIHLLIRRCGRTSRYRRSAQIGLRPKEVAEIFAARDNAPVWLTALSRNGRAGGGARVMPGDRSGCSRRNRPWARMTVPGVTSAAAARRHRPRSVEDLVRRAFGAFTFGVRRQARAVIALHPKAVTSGSSLMTIATHAVATATRCLCSRWCACVVPVLAAEPTRWVVATRTTAIGSITGHVVGYRLGDTLIAGVVHGAGVSWRTTTLCTECRRVGRYRTRPTWHTPMPPSITRVWY